MNITNQLSIDKFVIPSVAKKVLVMGKSIYFKLPTKSTKNSSNCVKISINTLGLYDIQFDKSFKVDDINISSFKDVSPDSLSKLFSVETGL